MKKKQFGKKEFGRERFGREKLIESMKLPLDVCMGEMRVTLTGSREAFIENYKGILEYTGQTILLQGKNNQVCITGNRLSIEYYTNEDMKISGNIEAVKLA